MDLVESIFDGEKSCDWLKLYIFDESCDLTGAQVMESAPAPAEEPLQMVSSVFFFFVKNL